MKIGFFTDFFLPSTMGGGVAVSIDIFRRELEKLGHKVYVFCPKETGYYPKKERIIRYKSIKGFWLWGYRDTLPYNHTNVRNIGSLNLDVIHIHTPAQIGLLGVYAAKKYKIPLVCSYHTDLVGYGTVYKRVILGLFLLSLVFPLIAKDRSLIKDFFWTLRPTWPIGKWNQRNIKHMITLLHNHCDLVITPSEKMKLKLLSYGTTTPIEVLPTGTDSKDQKLLKTDFDFRAKYNIDISWPVLLYVGRLGAEKNIELIIKALPRILNTKPQVRLVIVGHGPNKNNLVRLAKRLKVSYHVIFTGFVSDAIRISAYRACDIFVFPSLTDTQGLVLNEAALNAKPIVFLDEKISPVAIDKYSGLKAKNTSGDLAKKVLDLLDQPNLSKKLGLNAQKIVKDFSGNRQAEKLAQIYDDLIVRFKK